MFGLLKVIRSEEYDLVVNVQRFMSSGILAAWSKAKQISGFTKNPLSFLFTHKVTHEIGTGKHETERNLALIQAFCPITSNQVKLYTNHIKPSDFPVDLNENFICIAPASVWFTKQFPINQWVEFLKSIPEQKIYMIGAPSDEKMVNEIIQLSGHHKTTSLCGKLSLLASAALLKKSKMNFVNDSAPMHLASSVNAPVTAIFCSTMPEFGIGSLSDQSHIVQIQENLSCRPCGLHGKKECPKGHFNCAQNINISALKSLI